jgi:predicted nucleic acid-binding Zn ribbon protein
MPFCPKKIQLYLNKSKHRRMFFNLFIINVFIIIIIIIIIIIYI